MQKNIPLHSSYKILSGLSEIIHLYDFYLLDIWGLLHDGIKPFPGVLDCLKKLKSLGKKTLLLSNSPRRGSLVTTQLDKIGIGLDYYDHILTSGDATYEDLTDQVDSLGRKCFFIGQEMHKYILKDVDLDPVESLMQADFILNMGPEDLHLNLHSFLELFKPAVQKDILMICSNPDMTVMIGDTQVLCAGTLAKEYELLGGRVHYHGKPYKFVYELALKKLGIKDTSRILALGDSLHTDVMGAQNNRIQGALVMSGIHGHELQIPFGVLPTPRDVDTLTLQYHTTAEYYLTSLKW